MNDGVADDTAETSFGAHAVLLALSTAAFAFLCLLYPYLKGGLTEAEETKVFVLSCVVVPLAGVVSSWAVARTRRDRLPDSPYFYPLLSGAHAIFWAVGVHRLRALTTPDFRPRIRALVLIWFCGSIALTMLLYVTRHRRIPFGGQLVRAIDRGLPFVIVAALLPFATRTPLPYPYLALLFLAGFGSVFHEELGRFPRNRAARIVFDVLVVGGIALIVVDPAMDLDYFHSNFFLGPAAAVRSGRTLLYDVNCQYGVGVIYFLAAVFDLNLRLVPPSIEGLGFILSALSVIQYGVLYASLRSITRRPALAALVVALMIFAPRFEQMGYPIAYPSTGALRFGLGYMLVGVFALRGRFPQHRSWIFGLESLVVGVAAIWSFESFVYVLVAYLGSLVYEGAHVGRKGLFKLVEDRVAPTVLSITWFHLALAVFTWLRAGHWPKWSLYTDYLKLYSTGEFGTLPVETWTPWLILGGIYIATVIALGYRRITLGKTDLESPYAVVFAMSALGVGQFTYYLGRSHVNNLFHVAAPAFFVAGFWFITADETAAYLSRAMRSSFVFVGYGVSTFVAVHCIPDIMKKLDHSWLLYLVEDHRPFEHKPLQARVSDAIALERKYAPNARRVALFTHSDIYVEISLVTRKTSLWPEGYPPEDSLVEGAKNRIFGTDPGLKVGDVVFADTGSSSKVDPAQVHLAPQVDHIDRELFNRLVSKFAFDVVEQRASGWVALRLKDR